MAKASGNGATFRLARYAYTFTRFTEVFDKIKGDEERSGEEEVFF